MREDLIFNIHLIIRHGITKLDKRPADVIKKDTKIEKRKLSKFEIARKK